MISASPPTRRGSGRGLGRRVVDPTTPSRPVPAATASDLPRCAGEVTERNKSPSTQTLDPNQNPPCDQASLALPMTRLLRSTPAQDRDARFRMPDPTQPPRESR